MGRSCKLYADHLFGTGTRCDMNINVSIEAVNIIAHWEGLNVPAEGVAIKMCWFSSVNISVVNGSWLYLWVTLFADMLQ